MPFCPICGKYHDTMTGGCTNTYTVIDYPYTKSTYVYAPPATIESRLDQIIDLLNQILVKINLGGK